MFQPIHHFRRIDKYLGFASKVLFAFSSRQHVHLFLRATTISALAVVENLRRKLPIQACSVSGLANLAFVLLFTKKRFQSAGEASDVVRAARVLSLNLPSQNQAEREIPTSRKDSDTTDSGQVLAN